MSEETTITTTDYSFGTVNTFGINKNITKGELAKALAAVQGKLGAVSKGEKGYGYNYASLASTIEVSKEVLSKNGLAVSQLVGNHGGHPAVTTILMHESGEFIEGTASMERVPMKACNSAQEAGATLSYLRRYALQALLNMASEDNDASSEGFKGKKDYKKDVAGEKKTAAKKKKDTKNDETKTDKPFRKRRSRTTDEGF